MSYREQAEELASKPYFTLTFRDCLAVGMDIWVALNPQIKDCVASGETPEQAQANLLPVRVKLIEAMLERGDIIPMPIGGK